MGVPICANLVRAGYRVQAGDQRPEAAELATRCGAQWVSPVARLAAESDVLITVLPSTQTVSGALGPFLRASRESARDEAGFQLHLDGQGHHVAAFLPGDGDRVLG